MKEFDQYFYNYELLKTLSKYRASHAKRRHRLHLIRDISTYDKTNVIDSEIHAIPAQLKGVLPPRREWLALNKKEREKYKNSYTRNIARIRKTFFSVKTQLEKGVIDGEPDWYNRLRVFFDDIRTRIDNPDYIIKRPLIRAIQKQKRHKYRPIAVYEEIMDRIIITGTAKYFIDRFDSEFLPCSYAFRSAQNRPCLTHHDTIDAILEFRQKHLETALWVTECDLKKFFDCVNHDVAKRALRQMVRQVEGKGIPIDQRAIQIFDKYLDSYSFTNDCLIKGSEWFGKKENANDPKGEFSYEREGLEESYYQDVSLERLGVPQGGAISCLIANLILHEADLAVLSADDPNLFYVRYCDDMIIMHPDEEACRAALVRYENAIRDKQLLIHPLKEIGVYGRDFWSDQFKSKEPYRWMAKSNGKGCVPWLAFVGYQIRHDGLIRVRKSSMQKEMAKQKKETYRVLDAVNYTKKSHLSANSRKSNKQVIFSLQQRLHSMSVGKITLANWESSEPDFCWTVGFKNITDNPISRKQFKELDRHRKRQISLAKKKLQNLEKPVSKPDDTNNIPDYFGLPFSYYAALRRFESSRTSGGDSSNS